MTALSIGIGYPAAKLLLEHCEDKEGLAFHIMIASNPELDDKITSEPGGRPMAVKGFTGADTSASSLDVARVWIPHLARSAEHTSELQSLMRISYAFYSSK